jgi:hypothetical protein
VAVNRDGTIASASREELKLAQLLAKDSRGRAGRWAGGREQGAGGKGQGARGKGQGAACAARACGLRGIWCSRRWGSGPEQRPLQRGLLQPRHPCLTTNAARSRLTAAPPPRLLRFGGREGKMARIRLMEEEHSAQARAKLGVALPAAKAGGKSKAGGKAGEKRKAGGSKGGKEGSKRRKRSGSGGGGGDSSSSSSGDEGGTSSDTNLGQQQQRGEAKAEPKVYVVVMPDEGRPKQPFKPTPAQGW